MILFGYTDNKGILLGDRALGLFHRGVEGGLIFQLVCRFHRYWAYSSKSTVQPKMESCFQDGACSVCFLPLKEQRVKMKSVSTYLPNAY